MVAKAPVPGEAKTRLAAHVGAATAAELAAAGLLDTLEVMLATFPVVHVALAGEVSRGVRTAEIESALQRCRVFPQRGAGFGARLAAAHADAAGGHLVVQVGTDTPQLSSGLLTEVVEVAGRGRRTAVLGDALDGGWWVLALRDPALARALASVPMSRGDTGELTRRALVDGGAQVRSCTPLRDVDEPEDAEAAALAAPGGRFAEAWRQAARSWHRG